MLIRMRDMPMTPSINHICDTRPPSVNFLLPSPCDMRGDRERSTGCTDVNRLYYGDNLDILRNKINDETVDLIYLDPPFKSGVNYNLLFQAVGNDAVDAQVEAFKDTWKWGEAAERAYDDVRNYGKFGLALSGIRRWLGDKNEMMAYLAMMSVRLVEMQKKLKPLARFSSIVTQLQAIT